MLGLMLAVTGAVGVYLVVTAIAFRETAARRVRSSVFDHARLHHRFVRWMSQAGIGDVRPAEFVGVSALLALAGGVVGLAMFGGALPAVGVAVACAGAPLAGYRVRRATRMAAAHDAWPHMIEEIRVLTGAAGRSIPQALLEVGLRGPAELREAFAAAQREWAITTDFERTVQVVKQQLGDPTADATCETLLVAHEVGGADLDRRLAELAEDRRAETLGRKDARAKQAGVRFARRFVVFVPVGMALAGMSLGNGRAAYQEPVAQVLVAIGLALVAVCWVWSGSMLRLPEQDRVFR